MCALAFIQTISGTINDRPSRLARKTWPNPPSPSNRSMLYWSCVSGLVMTCAGTNKGPVRLAWTDIVLRVVAEDTGFGIDLSVSYAEVQRINGLWRIGEMCRRSALTFDMT